MTTPSLTQSLAERLARPVPPEARARARLHLLDWLGCVAGALGSDVARAARRAEPDLVTRAALLGNVLEMDDVHRLALLHPGPVVWPAALAAAREHGCDMGALLDAGVRGYETAIAVGATLDAHHYAHHHPTSTAGGFGAVAAAASILGLAPAPTAWALGNWGSIAGGLWRMRHEPVMTKQLHVAHAAIAGLWCARLARAGFTGPTHVLEGEQGLYAASVPEPRPLPTRDGWLLDEVSFKPWPACRHAHPAIDAALMLRDRGALGEGPIRIATYADALRFCDRPAPATPAQARFSLQHAVAVVAVRGRPTLADFEADAIGDAALGAARARVVVVEDDRLTRAYPARYGARAMSAGTVAWANDTWGDPERPMAATDLEAKARALIAWGRLDDDEADRAIELTLERDPARGTGKLVKLLERWLS